jgi:hypothetical protein
MVSFINAGISSQRIYNAESLIDDGGLWRKICYLTDSINEGANGPFVCMDVPVYSSLGGYPRF